jgi:2-polyprenyl-3-methyl-5-hydroxy-6-metoxy-1,4-benzoquinol methylase
MNDMTTPEDRVVLVESYNRGDHDENPGLERYAGIASYCYPGLHGHVAELAAGTVGRGGRVLDLGAGAGALSLRLADLGFDVTASDAGNSFRPHERARFIQADLNQDFADLAGPPFDAVFALEIIEHLENPRHFLRQVRKALLPGGRLILTTPNIEAPHSVAQFLRKGTYSYFTDTDYEVSGHITPVGQWQLRKMLQEAGFRSVRMTGFGAPRRRFGMRHLRAALVSLLLDRRCRETGTVLVVQAEV